MKVETRPNFFIIGAAKAATTSLSSLLDAHPQAAIVQGKEPHFFSYDHVFSRGWREYLKLFKHCRGESAIGDASTSYSRIRYHPSVVARIRQHVPDAKVIYMVRHPLERMESAYVEHICTPGRQAFASINDAVKHQPMIVDSSRYWEVFDAYRKEFDESRIKIVWFEEYIADPTSVFRDVCRFLEIDDSIVPNLDRQSTNSRENAASRMARLGRSNIQLNTTWEEEIRRWVIDQIRDDNSRFLAHFRRPKSYWGDLY
jgi:Sulfotransferase family